MVSPQIVVEHLSKHYRVPERAPGLRPAATSLLRRTFRTVEAVSDVTFSVDAGEMVAVLGPNGAGKTTTLKMLAGLLYPTTGTATVGGFVPWERRPAYLRQISMVLGNKSQLWWGLTPADGFRIVGDIYAVPSVEFRQTLDELVALLEMEVLLAKPVRLLSLGERMKCELVAALLHRPAVLFLDEPTLGLDVSMQQRLRRFIAEYNRRTGATVLLTSHYMADVLALCSRVIFIDRGRLVYDGDLRALAHRLAPFKLIRLVVDADTRGDAGLGDGEALHIPAEADVQEHDGNRWVLRVDRTAVPRMTAQLLQALPVLDLTVEEPPIEDVMDQLYLGAVQ